MKQLLTISLMLTSFLFSQGVQWKWMNPKPNGIDLNQLYMVDANKVYMFGVLGTAQRTLDGGATTEYKRIDGSNREIERVHFFDANNGFASGQDGLLLKTTDAGETWSNVNTMNTVEDLWAINFLTPNFGFVGGTGGKLFRTTNGGTSWDSLNSGVTVTIYSISVLSATNVVFVTATNSGSPTAVISRSTDGGNTFTPVAPASATKSQYSVSFSDANNGISVGAAGQAHYTTDGGATWTPAQNLGAGNIFAISQYSSSIVYGVSSLGVFYKSSNGGVSWDSLKLADATLRGVQRVGSTMFIVGDYGIILKSTDAGETWTSVSSAFTYKWINKIKFFNENEGFAAGGSTTAADSLGYLYKTTDGGNTWSPLPFNFKRAAYSFAAPSQTTIYASIYDNRIFKSTDAGATWVQQTSPATSSYRPYQTVFASLDTGYIVGTSATVLKTTNGGTDWVKLSTTGFTGTNIIYDAHAYSANEVIIGGAGGKIQRTTDGGATWTTPASGLTSTCFTLDFNGDIGLAGGNASTTGQLSLSTDRGATWSALTIPALKSIKSVSVVSPLIYWIGDQNGRVLYSTNAGVNWTEVETPNTDEVGDISVAGSFAFFAGEDGILLRANADPNAVVPVELTSFSASALEESVKLEWTTASELNNKGFAVERSSDKNSWSQIGFVDGNGTTTEKTSYSFVDNSPMQSVSYYRLKQTDFDGSFVYSNVVEFQNGTPIEYKLNQNYPNPFNPSTVVSFSVKFAGETTIKVYDILGNEVATLYNGMLQAGSHSYTFNASALSSGVYLLSIKSGSFNSSIKMLLSK